MRAFPAPFPWKKVVDLIDQMIGDAGDDLPPKKWTELCRSALVFGWGQIPQSGVQAARIIKALDISEQVPSRVISGFVVAMVNAFGFKGVKETFHRGVVPAIALPAHGWSDVRRGEGAAVSL